MLLIEEGTTVFVVYIAHNMFLLNTLCEMSTIENTVYPRQTSQIHIINILLIPPLVYSGSLCKFIEVFFIVGFDEFIVSCSRAPSITIKRLNCGRDGVFGFEIWYKVG